MRAVLLFVLCAPMGVANAQHASHALANDIVPRHYDDKTIGLPMAWL